MASKTTSKTAMTALVKDFRWKEIDEALADSPALLSVRDERGRNWLHLCCGVNVKSGKLKAADSIKTAEVLIRRGLDIIQEAFTEGNWKATPLWYAIARGENLPLAEYLLKHGSTPNYSLWAAAFNNDLEAIRLLIRHGANLEDAFEDETPFLSAIKTSHFRSAEELLKLGADVNYGDSKGMTALHYMLKKDSDKKHFPMLIAHGARGDIKNKEGATAAEIMRKKKDPDFHEMADHLR
jgi:ankyrin repeat protein